MAGPRDHSLRLIGKMVFGLALAALGFSTRQVSAKDLSESSGQEAGRRVGDSVRTTGRCEEHNNPTRDGAGRERCSVWRLPTPSEASGRQKEGARPGLAGRPLFSRAPKYIQQGLPAGVYTFPRVSGQPWGCGGEQIQPSRLRGCLQRSPGHSVSGSSQAAKKNGRERGGREGGGGTGKAVKQLQLPDMWPHLSSGKEESSPRHPKAHHAPATVCSTQSSRTRQNPKSCFFLPLGKDRGCGVGHCFFGRRGRVAAWQGHL